MRYSERDALLLTATSNSLYAAKRFDMDFVGISQELTKSERYYKVNIDGRKHPFHLAFQGEKDAYQFFNIMKAEQGEILMYLLYKAADGCIGDYEKSGRLPAVCGKRPGAPRQGDRI